MSNILSDLYINTYYQLAVVVGMSLLPAVVTCLYGAFRTKDKRFTWFIFSSFLSVFVLVSIGNFAVLYGFKDLNIMIKLQAYLYTALLLSFNTYQLVEAYIKEMGGKRFDPDHVTREHFRKSVGLGFIVLLIGGSTVLFAPVEMTQLILSTMTATAISIVIQHLVARRVFRDTN